MYVSFWYVIPFYTAFYTLFSSIPMHSIFYSFLCFTTLPSIPYSILYSLLFCNFTVHPIFHFLQLYHIFLHCFIIILLFYIFFYFLFTIISIVPIIFLCIITNLYLLFLYFSSFIYLIATLQILIRSFDLPVFTLLICISMLLVSNRIVSATNMKQLISSSAALTF